MTCHRDASVRRSQPSVAHVDAPSPGFTVGQRRDDIDAFIEEARVFVRQPVRRPYAPREYPPKRAKWFGFQGDGSRFPNLPVICAACSKRFKGQRRRCPRCGLRR